jgi:hypothetical protein
VKTWNFKKRCVKIFACWVILSIGSLSNGYAKQQSNTIFDYLSIESYGKLEYIMPTGYFAIGMRYIHPPRVEWVVLESCTRYELILVQGDKILGITNATTSPHFIENGWDKITPGKKAAVVIQGFDKEGQKKALSGIQPFYAALDYDPAVASKKKRSYRQAAIMAFEALYNYKFPAGTSAPTEGPASKILPILLAAANGPNYAYDHNFPVLHDWLHVDMLVALNKIADQNLKLKIMDYADSVGTHLLICRILDEDFMYKGMIRGCADYEGKGALGIPSVRGTAEEEQIRRLVEPAKCGYAAEALVKLYELTGHRKYLDAASQIAEILVKTQREDGSWPARVDGKTGEVIAEYSTSAVAAISFLDRLNKNSPDKRWFTTRNKAIEWIQENPLKTYGWVLLYDDADARTANSNMYQTLSNYDLFKFICYAAANPEAVDNAAEHIKRQFEWCDNHFTFYGDDPILGFNPHYPSVCEQGKPAIPNEGCWCPMDGHTVNWGRAHLATYLLTKNKLNLEKAKAAANTLTQVQVDNGATLTWMPDSSFGISHRAMATGSGLTFWPAGWAGAATLWAELVSMGLD